MKTLAFLTFLLMTSVLGVTQDLTAPETILEPIISGPSASSGSEVSSEFPEIIPPENPDPASPVAEFPEIIPPENLDQTTTVTEFPEIIPPENSDQGSGLVEYPEILAPEVDDIPNITNPVSPGVDPSATIPALTVPSVGVTGPQTSSSINFMVKNSERAMDFFYTIIKKEGNLLPTGQDLFTVLEKVNSKRIRLSGQDWSKVTLKVDEALVGYFWDPKVHKSLGSQVTLGFLLPFEVPAGRTVLLSEENFLSYNKNRSQGLTLSQAGWTSLPQHILDGKFTDWEGQRPLAEWKKNFNPSIVSREDDNGLSLVSSVVDLPTVLGKPRSVKAVLEDDRLWLSVTQWEPFVPGKTLAYYFFLERNSEIPSDMTVFIPVKGDTGPVWVYRPGSPLPQRGGFYSFVGTQLEAHIFDPELKKLIDKGWDKVTVDFSQFLKLNNGYEEYFYATFPVTEKTE